MVVFSGAPSDRDEGRVRRSLPDYRYVYPSVEVSHRDVSNFLFSSLWSSLSLITAIPRNHTSVPCASIILIKMVFRKIRRTALFVFGDSAVLERTYARLSVFHRQVYIAGWHSSRNLAQ